ncbi:MAG: two-component system sensor histidine kinase NtrB [bacterium]
MNSIDEKKKKTQGIPLFTTYAVVSIFLLIILLVVYALNQLRRQKIEMYNLLEYQGQALIQSLEISWQNAILSDSLVRQQIAERLLDNAYMIDRIMSSTGANEYILKQLVRDTNLFRVIITDAFGRPVLDSLPPFPSPDPSVPGLPIEPAQIVTMFNHILSGQKKQLLVGSEPSNPIQEDLLWVAVARRTVPGAIIIHVQADYLHRFRSEIGLSKIIKEIGSKPGIEYLIYEDPFNRIISQKGESGPPTLTQPLYNYLKQEESRSTQISLSKTGERVMEIRHPFSFRGKRIGLMRVGLSLSKLKEAERTISSQALWFGGLLIGLGIIGILLIFFHQYRQYWQQKVREKEMQRTDKLISIGKLAAGVAHEIRNPLNAISMAIQRLQNEFLPSSEEDKNNFLQFSRVIREEIKRVDKIITEFLNFTKKSLPVKSFVSLNKLTDDLVLFLSAEAEKNKVTIEKNYNKNGIKVWCDPDQIKQCMINIIRNAIQAMPNGGKITINLQLSKHEAIISIKDTGPGLTDSQKNKIFEFYYTDKEGGIGLGLPISQKIIEDHCGRIEVDSEVGKGSQFTLYLPYKIVKENDENRRENA